MTMPSQLFTQHARPSTSDDAREYNVRVRDKIYLWGSAGIKVDVRFTPPPVLHIWNDTFGEPITIGTLKANGAHKTLGTLKPGEHFSIELHDISGVFAECSLESRVACRIDRT
jgi:hypothetical protein